MRAVSRSKTVKANALDRELSWPDVVPEWQHGADWLCSASWALQQQLFWPTSMSAVEDPPGIARHT